MDLKELWVSVVDRVHCIHVCLTHYKVNRTGLCLWNEERIIMNYLKWIYG